MATVRKTLTAGSWTRISAAGEDGTIWIKESPRSGVYLDHTDQEGADLIAEGSTAELEKNKAYGLRSGEPMPVTADSVTDVYYVFAEAGSPVVVADFA